MYIARGFVDMTLKLFFIKKKTTSHKICNQHKQNHLTADRRLKHISFSFSWKREKQLWKKKKKKTVKSKRDFPKM